MRSEVKGSLSGDDNCDSLSLLEKRASVMRRPRAEIGLVFQPPYELLHNPQANIGGPAAKVLTHDFACSEKLRHSSLHSHHLIHGQHVLVQMVDDPKRTADEQRDDKHGESQR
jgi:hypothetical protein